MVMIGWEVLRQFGQRFGPYLLLEILLPGGTLFALALFLYQRWKINNLGPDVEFGILSLLLFAGFVLLTAYRAVTSPFFVLLAYRLIALPSRCLSISGRLSLASSFLHARVNEGTPPDAFSPLAGIPLRI